MSHEGVWITGSLGNVRLMAGLNDLEGHLPPKLLYDSIYPYPTVAGNLNTYPQLELPCSRDVLQLGKLTIFLSLSVMRNVLHLDYFWISIHAAPFLLWRIMWV